MFIYILELHIFKILYFIFILPSLSIYLSVLSKPS